MYIMKLVGTRNEWWVNAFSFIYYILALCLIFFVSFRLTEKIEPSLWAVYLLSSIPLYYIHGTSPYFDVFQSVYFLLASYMIYLFHTKQVHRIVAWVYLWILGFTKSEGLIIYTSSVIIWYVIYSITKWIPKSIWTNDMITIIKIIWTAILINLPFIIFKGLYGLGFWNGDASIWETALWFHPEIFPAMYNALFFTWAYNLLFFFALITLIEPV
jgi:hypothetical protein